MERSNMPPPPPPPPLPPGAQRVHSSALPQLPPHLQAMIQQQQAAAHQDLRSELPMQFGSQPKSYHHRQSNGGGRGHNNSNYNHPHGGRGSGVNGRGRGGGGRGRGGYGSGRGRGGASHYGSHGHHQFNQQRGGRGHNNNQQFKRKREPSDDVRDPSRFFLPSCLEDPWKHLLAQPHGMGTQGSMEHNQQHQQPQHFQQQQQHDSQPPFVPPQLQQQRHAPKFVVRPGRVLFQPSFLADPWAMLVR